jgi:hypothetical protein
MRQVVRALIPRSFVLVPWPTHIGSIAFFKPLSHYTLPGPNQHRLELGQAAPILLRICARPVEAQEAPILRLQARSRPSGGRPCGTQIHRLCLIPAATSMLGACTMGHRIESPTEPIRIEMTVLLKHEHVPGSGAARG